jgi:hypothetical protein
MHGEREQGAACERAQPTASGQHQFNFNAGGLRAAPGMRLIWHSEPNGSISGPPIPSSREAILIPLLAAALAATFVAPALRWS